MDSRKLPNFDYPSNSLIEEKSSLSVAMWKKLCIFSTVLELCSTKVNAERHAFSSYVELAKQCNAVMEKYSKMIINHYKDLIPIGLTLSDLFSKEDDEDDFSNIGNSGRSSSKRQSTLNSIVTEGNASKIIEYYQREFDSSFNSVTKTFFSIWERVLDENEDSRGFIKASEDDLLYELRRRVHNRIRKINQKRELSNLFWFPVDWLCFLAFGLNDDDQEWLKHNRIIRLKDLAGGAKLNRQSSSAIIPVSERVPSPVSRSVTTPSRRSRSTNPAKPPPVSNSNHSKSETFGLPQSLGDFPAAFPFVSFEAAPKTHSQFLSSVSLLERKRKSSNSAPSSFSSPSVSSSFSSVHGIPSFNSLSSSDTSSFFAPPQLFGNPSSNFFSKLFPVGMFPQSSSLSSMSLGSFGSQNYYTNPLSPDSSIPIINGIQPLRSSVSAPFPPSASTYQQPAQNNTNVFASSVPQSLRITSPNTGSVSASTFFPSSSSMNHNRVQQNQPQMSSSSSLQFSSKSNNNTTIN
jgi:hypothetical protein